MMFKHLPQINTNPIFKIKRLTESKEHNATQYGSISRLLEGFLDGIATFKEVSKSGTFGIGTIFFALGIGPSYSLSIYTLNRVLHSKN